MLDEVLGGFDYRDDKIVHFVISISWMRRLACGPPTVYIDRNARLVDRTEVNCMACIATLAEP